MNIFKRISLILKSFINSVLDACENPAILVDQYVREAEETVSRTRSMLVSARVNVRKREKAIVDIEAAIEDNERFAKQAILMENEEDLVIFADKNILLRQQLETEKTYLTEAQKIVEELEAGYRLASIKSNEIKTKRDTLKSRSDIVKMKKYIASIDDMKDPYSELYLGFSRLEDKIEIDALTVEEETEVKKLTLSADEEIADKYRNIAHAEQVRAEIDSLKSRFAEHAG